ncbi:MAG: hypothetical protein Q4D05_06435, partial [Acinetobacter sp.]|nr:hypothetical protein [Acinetobacter sp.]
MTDFLFFFPLFTNLFGLVVFVPICFILYVILLYKIARYGIQEQAMEKTIKIFSLVSFIPAITFIIGGFIHLFFMLYPLMIKFTTLTITEIIFFLTFILLWTMPTLFLLFKKKLS